MRGKSKPKDVGQKIFASIPYSRYIPEIFGRDNVYDIESLLLDNNTTFNTFVAQLFVGSMTINHENTIGFQPLKDKDTFNILIKNNDEIRLSESASSATIIDENSDQIYIPLMRPGFDIYGHWLLDLLPKLSLFEKLNPHVKYTILLDERCSGWTLELISLLFHNFTTIKMIKTGDVIKGSFFLSSPIRHHDFISEMCRINSSKIENNVSSERKIYISRKHLNLNHRQLKNSARIERLFERKGFELMYPEELSISQQINIFKQTSILAGEAGSGLHNSIFCSKDTKIINIQSGRQNHFIQASLCNQYGQDVIYVTGKTDSEDWGSSFKIRTKDCKAALKKALFLI